MDFLPEICGLTTHIYGLSSGNGLTDDPYMEFLPEMNWLTVHVCTFFQKCTDWQSIYGVSSRNGLTDGPYMDFLPEMDWLKIHIWNFFHWRFQYFEVPKYLKRLVFQYFQVPRCSEWLVFQYFKVPRWSKCLVFQYFQVLRWSNDWLSSISRFTSNQIDSYSNVCRIPGFQSISIGKYDDNWIARYQKVASYVFFDLVDPVYE